MVMTYILVCMMHFCFVVCISPYTYYLCCSFPSVLFAELFIVSALMFLSYQMLALGPPQWLKVTKRTLLWQ